MCVSNERRRKKKKKNCPGFECKSLCKAGNHTLLEEQTLSHCGGNEILRIAGFLV